MTSSTDKNENKKVIVLGAGFAGITIVRLLATRGIPVTLISDKKFAFYKYVAPRAAVIGKEWLEATQIPLNGLAAMNVQVVVGRIVKVNEETKTIELEDGQKIEGWAVLVCATGSRAKGVAEPPISATTEESFREHFENTRVALGDSKNIVIAGGGPIGIEFAGEIRSFLPQETKITIVTGKPGLLGVPKPPFSKAFMSSVREMLRANDVKVVKDEVVDPVPSGNGAGFIKPNQNRIKLASGNFLECDLLVFAAGVQVNSEFYPPTWVDYLSKELKVERNYLVKGQTNVFAIGDVAQTGRTKLGRLASEDAEIVTHNIMSVLNGKPPTKKYPTPSRSHILISFGPKKGRGVVPFLIFGTMKLGDSSTAAFKSFDMHIAAKWKQLAIAAPPLLPTN